MFARITKNALRNVSRRTRSFRGRPQTLLSLHRQATTLVTVPPSSDDAEIVSLFDQPQNGRQSRPLSVSGIFQHPELTTPVAFNALAESTLVRAQLLTERILRANQSRPELFKVVKNLDRLSDLLCGVIDLAELLRNAHPDPQWVRCANDSYEKLCEYMNVLNTHVGLYEASGCLLIPVIANVAIDSAYGSS
jgi:intermediate peptidase